jgi:AcrR family transcriptional regulator
MARTVNKIEDRREQIMEAALRVFAEKGYPNTSNKDIAREAGITPGLIYHYFESKEALLKAIFADRSPQKVIRSIPPEMLEQPPAFFLRFLFTQMLISVEDPKFMALLRIYLPEAIYHPEMAPFVTSIIAEGSNFLESYLSAQVEAGALRKTDSRLVTSLVMGSIMDIALRRQVIHEPLTRQYSQEQIVEGLVSLALEGLLPR